MLVCSNCPNTFSTTEPRWRCECGGYLLLQDRPAFSLDALRGRPPGLWRYHDGLGLSNLCNAVSLGEGSTPMIEIRLEGKPVTLKLDYLCPTGSYKDRGSAVMISKLKEMGRLRDHRGLIRQCRRFHRCPRGRCRYHGEHLRPGEHFRGKGGTDRHVWRQLDQVPGSRSDAAAAAWAASQHTFYGSHNWSPYFLAGLKTAAYEIAEQFSWDPPDWVVIPAGGGGLLAGLYFGWRELFEAGLIRRVPRLAAIQSASCDPIYQAWAAGASDIPGVRPVSTAAEGIAVARPVRGKTILEAIRATSGVVRTVEDDAIWETLALLGRRGVYVEPTAAAASAAIRSLFAEGTIAREERVVVILTGNGLKATDKIVAHLGAAASSTVPA